MLCDRGRECILNHQACVLFLVHDVVSAPVLSSSSVLWPWLWSWTWKRLCHGCCSRLSCFRCGCWSLLLLLLQRWMWWMHVDVIVVVVVFVMVGLMMVLPLRQPYSVRAAAPWPAGIGDCAGVCRRWWWWGGCGCDRCCCDCCWSCCCCCCYCC